MRESTRIKAKMVVENQTPKTSGSVWSKEDEVSLLQAMVDFQDSKQCSPYADMGEFLDFVNPCLHFNVQRRQLTDKLWKLRYKFLNSMYDSTIPHHAKLLEISNSIVSWKQHATMGLDDPNVDADVGESDGVLNGVEKVNKGKLGNGEKENVAVEDEVSVDEGLKGVTKKRRLLKRGGENVEEVNVAIAKRSKKKGKLVTGEEQSNKGDDVVVDDVGDVGAGEGQLLAKEKSKGDVVTADQNVEKETIANAVVNNVQSRKKKGKKRAKVLGDEHVAREEVNRKDFRDCELMFPELINKLESETLSMMPQPIKKKCVMDTINAMGWVKANELEEEWADVRVMELELKARKFALKSKQMNLMLEAARTDSRP